MSTLFSSVRLLAVAAAAMLAFQAHAGNRPTIVPSLDAVQPGANLSPTYVDVNIAGWVAVDDFGVAGNSSLFLDVAPGSTITGFEYSNLQFSTDAGGDSWLNELVLSVNNDTASQWLDWAPSTTGDAGTFGPASGSWGGATGEPGPYGAGGSFTAASGTVYVTTYLSYYTAPVGITVNSGTLRIYYDTSVVPEPATYGLMGLGLLGVLGVARRRHHH